MGADQELLEGYVRDRSQEAFRLLVARHLDLVYAAAQRQMGNAEEAEDVTQAVFIMLATKATSMRANVILPAWLLTATWYACKNAMRQGRRRRLHERSAGLMRSETQCEEIATSDPPIGQVLDDALMSLRGSDRAAVVMHYLQGQTFNEVAAALHTTPEAARKRAKRAVWKLRSFFDARGVTMEPEALATGMTHQSALRAPTALGAAVVATVVSVTATSASAATGAGSVGSAVGASGSADALAQTSLQSMAAGGTKVAAGIAASLMLLTAVTVAVYGASSRSRITAGSGLAGATTKLSASPLVPADAGNGDPVAGADRIVFRNDQIAQIVPQVFPNVLVKSVGATTDGHFIFEDDPTVKRQPDGEPTPSITSPGPSLMPGLRGMAVPAAAWRGKRVEVSVYLRTQDVRETTGMNVLVWGPSNQIRAGGMNGGPLRMAGTHDWTRMACVLDMPEDAQRIEFGMGLWGAGRVWLDSFAMQSVPQTVPTTSDTLWHLSTQFTSQYRLLNDFSQPRNGHATARLESSEAGGADAIQKWAKLIRAERSMETMRGKRVRVRAMLRGETVTGSAGVFVHAGHFDERRQYTQKESMNLALRGTSPWLRYATTLNVPPEADVLEYGVRIEGLGTVWIDELTMEVLP